MRLGKKTSENYKANKGQNKNLKSRFLGIKCWIFPFLLWLSLISLSLIIQNLVRYLKLQIVIFITFSMFVLRFSAISSLDPHFILSWLSASNPGTLTFCFLSSTPNCFFMLKSQDWGRAPKREIIRVQIHVRSQKNSWSQDGGQKDLYPVF